MASITKDSRNGRWLARWRDPQHRQRKKSFGRKVDAERFLAALLAEMNRGNYLDPAAGKVTVGEFATVWVAGLSHLKESTAERYRGIVRNHVVPKWGSTRLSNVAPSDVAAWIGELTERGASPSTVRQVHRVFSLIMDLALRDGRIGRNPAVGVRLPRAVRGEPRFLSPPELTALVRASGSGGLAICVLAFTGIRFGELTALRVVRVDLARRRLHIAESASEIGGRLVWSTTKNHQTRSVPVPPGLVPMLEEAVAGKEPGDLVFMSPHGGPLRLGNWRTRVFDPACAAAGIVGLTPHDLRHTAASLAIAAGANVKAVQRMLGHSSAAMTLDVYAGLFGDDLDSVAALLDAHVPQMRHSGEIATLPGGRNDAA
ncbi:MAG TPA: site-specific integrase [Pedococcus sp.]|nr:site-specific integrase [Pedococcus sp.]